MLVQTPKTLALNLLVIILVKLLTEYHKDSQFLLFHFNLFKVVQKGVIKLQNHFV